MLTLWLPIQPFNFKFSRKTVQKHLCITVCTSLKRSVGLGIWVLMGRLEMYRLWVRNSFERRESKEIFVLFQSFCTILLIKTKSILQCQCEHLTDRAVILFFTSLSEPATSLPRLQIQTRILPLMRFCVYANK